MAESAIEWTDATWNPVSGCTRASEGCDNCYAVTMTNRLSAMGNTKYDGLTVLDRNKHRHFNGKVRCHEDELKKPLHWRTPKMVFVNSMSDLFHKDVPFEFIDKVFAVINATGFTLPAGPNSKRWHTYQILTKRADRMREYMESRRTIYWKKSGSHPLFNAGRGEEGSLRHQNHGGHIMNAGAVIQWPPPNCWLGVSVENQKYADERIPHLLQTPAAVRFLSCEPLLGPVDIEEYFLPKGTLSQCPTCGYCDENRHPGETALCDGGCGQVNVMKQPSPGINWVIVGGESGHGARPCDATWIRNIVSQCKSAAVPCFVKQLGADVHTDEQDCGWGREMIPLYVNTETIGNGKVPVGHQVKLKHRKGGDPTEWPADLRVREFPTTPAEPKE